MDGYKRVYKKRKKATVELTSLLDLLFVMIFVSLIQQKDIKIEPKKTPKPKPKIVKPVAKAPSKAVKKPAPQVLKQYSITAKFHFYATPNNPTVPTGTYEMRGSFDEKTRSLKLAGVSWIDYPKGIPSNVSIDMVPLSGKIDETNSLFKGRVESPNCKEFTLGRKETIGNSPISGKWVGVYDCYQGSTGLTLTIQ